jgi:uncharacterized protein (TIGR02391 family)
MAKKISEQPKAPTLTLEIINNGIARLERRIKELEEFDISIIQERFDPQIESLTTKINDTIAGIFGRDTGEYYDYYISTLDTLESLPVLWNGEYSLPIVKEGNKKGISTAIIKLKSLVETLEEKRSDMTESIDTKVISNDFWKDIHIKIMGIAKSRFESGHYSDAVESALKLVNSSVKDIVRRKTGKELDGATLMFTAFSPNNPLIVLADLSTESGKNIQKGYMEIFAGAMIGIRNPKAHENLSIDTTRAIHLLYLSSLLMYKVDERI